MNAGVLENGKFVETKIGVPQGGNLSPLLSNIMLNELDKELERRGHKFVRYADDCMISCKSVTYSSQLIIALFVCKLRNRRIPNGTYGGVRGQRLSHKSLYNFIKL